MEMLISAYIDGELTEQERTTVEAHLRECAVCRATVTAFSQIHSLYQKLEPQKAPRDFRPGIIERLEMPSSRWFPGRFPEWELFPRQVYAIIVLALIIVVGGVMAIVFLRPPDEVELANAIDIYAEDVLFGETTLTMEGVLAMDDMRIPETADLSKDIDIAEEILRTIDFSDGDTSSSGPQSAQPKAAQGTIQENSNEILTRYVSEEILPDFA